MGRGGFEPPKPQTHSRAPWDRYPTWLSALKAAPPQAQYTYVSSREKWSNSFDFHSSSIR